MLIEESDNSAEHLRADHGAILAFVDFSEGSRHALAYAAELASDLGAQLHVVHIIHDPANAPGYYRPKEKKRQKTLTRIEDSAEELMRSFVAETMDACRAPQALANARLRLQVGLVVPRMVEITERLQPRVAVLGSHGRTNLGDLLLGSKTAQFVRLSTRPVLVVKQSP